MSDFNMFESLEERRLLAARISVGPNQIYLNAVKGQESTYELRFQNVGDRNLILLPGSVVVRGDHRYNFEIDFPEEGIAFRPGRQVNVTVRFKAFNSDAAGIKNAFVRIASNDPRKPVAKVPLLGLVTNGEGGANEPATQRLMNFFNLQINTGQPDSDNNTFNPNYVSPDEVEVDRFVKAGPGNVTIAPLAVFGNNSDPGIRMGYYTPGVLDSEKYIWYVPGSTTQSVAPLVYGSRTFDPGNSPFGIVTEYPNFVNSDGSIRKVYSEDALNLSWDDVGEHMKFYVYKDAKGNVVPNAYIGIQEEYDQSYDYNDTIFIITNVKPANSQPVLSYENVSGYPSNDWMVFNKIQNHDEYVGNITRTSNILRLRNSGDADLIFSTNITGDFAVGSGGGNNIVIAPGQSRDLRIDFTATSGHTNHPGTLTITTNDPNQPTVSIHLEGFWQQYSEFTPGKVSVEPSVQMIVNKIFGFKTVITNPGQNLSNGGYIQKVGDEILAQRFRIADSNSRVRVVEIATFHGQWYENEALEKKPTNSFIGWYKPGANTGTTILTDEHVAGQMILPPKVFGNENQLATYASPIAAGHFSPGSPTQEFGFVVENKEWSEYSKNPWIKDEDKDGEVDGPRPANWGQFLRWFPLYDQEGKLVPNTYIMLHDYNREGVVNYDFNDNIYIISNIIPITEDPLVKPLKTAYGFKMDDGRNRIIFTAPSDGAKVVGYNVYRALEARGEYELLTSTLLPRRAVTTWTDDNPAAGTNYYAVVAVGENGAESQPLIVKL